MDERALEALERALNYMELQMGNLPPFSEQKQMILADCTTLRGMIKRYK